MDTSRSEYAQRAKALFYKGYNCSQAVVGAWAEQMGLTEDCALKLAAGFGGGIGRMREVCGALCGAVMIVGMLRSSGQAGAEPKREMYEIVQRLAARFKEENGADTIICRELLGLDGRDTSPKPAARTEEYYKKRPCPELAALAAALVEEFV